MLKFSAIKKMGRSPRLARTAEEVEARLQKMRRWTKGPFNKAISWLVQLGVAIFTTVYMRIFNKTRVHHRERLKSTTRPYMYVSNHLTMFDDFFIDSLLYLPYAFTDIRNFPWHAPEEKNFFLGPVIGFFMQKAQCIPLTRGHGVFQPGMTRLKELLQDDAIVHIYPEGTRSRSGDIGKGQVGVGRLAYQSRAKVLPVYHEGTQDLLPIGSHRLRVGKRVEVIVGEPLDLTDLYDQNDSRDIYQQIATRMVDAIRALRDELHASGHGIHPIPEPKTEKVKPEDAEK
ncbi:1-acyl-sn-glycerol-3-phosphate acyltransferase [bacterium]|nr:1-acyl-sn-glycerol-3-phosphate acyltransferase [bacterium]